MPADAIMNYVFSMTVGKKMSRSAALSLFVAKVAALPDDRPRRIAVNGRITSGKTTLADEFADELNRQGHSARRIGVDGFHNPRSIRYRQGRNSAQGYYEDAYNLEALRDVLLKPLGKNPQSADGIWKIRTAIHDLETDTPIEKQFETMAARDILIVDGSFLLVPKLRGFWDYSIFIDVDRETGAERGAIRDADQFNGITEARRLHDERYQVACDIYLQENVPHEFADVVFRNNHLDEPHIQFASGQ